MIGIEKIADHGDMELPPGTAFARTMLADFPLSLWKVWYGSSVRAVLRSRIASEAA